MEYEKRYQNLFTKFYVTLVLALISRDVIQIQTNELPVLLYFYVHESIEQQNTYLYKLPVQKGSSFFKSSTFCGKLLLKGRLESCHVQL